MKFLQESNSNSIYPNADSADKDEYNNIINKSKYPKKVRKEVIWFIALKV